MAEIISSFAIVVTLIVLLVEVRGNTAAVQASTYQDVATSITTMLNHRATDPDVARIWIAGNGGEQLGPLDEHRYDTLVTLNMRQFENAYYQYQIGGIEESQWQPIENIISGLMRTTGHRLWWPTVRLNYSVDFRDLVDSLAGTETG